jgi:thymidylate synthase (FAD)
MDKFFRVGVINQMDFPQQTCWYGMHQDYFEGSVLDVEAPEEGEAGRIAVKHLLLGNRGHFGPLEHVQIVFATAGFPHSVMQQARTHRVGVSFDVQSFRYTGSRIADAAHGIKALEEVFYLRPVGEYTNREGKRFNYTEERRLEDLELCAMLARQYAKRMDEGCPEEQARGVIPFDVRQNFVVSFNLRSVMHLLDLRSKGDAQLEIRQMCELMVPHLHEWAPEIFGWYESWRLGKARLAP